MLVRCWKNGMVSFAYMSVRSTMTYLDTELVFEGSQRSGGGLLLGRGESSGGGDEGGEDGGLHFGIVCLQSMQK